jgi:hypothetical protein
MHVRAGFRAIFRQPALALAEIVWRWAFGAAAWVLIFVAVRRILAHVDITQLELLIARHSDLFLIADACARIVIQVLPQLARECLVMVPAIAILWIAAATVGRAVTLQTLFSHKKQPFIVPAATTLFGQLTLLNAVRALFTLITAIALLGALFFTGMMVPPQNLPAAAALSIIVAGVVALLWSVVNWFLALAPIWIVRDGRPALKSIADSLDLYRRSPGQYAGIASWFGFMRTIAFVAAFIAALIASQASPAASIALCLVIALVYFAVADFLYIVRLASFVALDESTQPSGINIQPSEPAPLIESSAPPANSVG